MEPTRSPLPATDVTDVTASDLDGWMSTTVTMRDVNPGYHVNNLEIERVFFEVRNQYLLAVDPDVWSRPVVPQIRELVTRFDAEITVDIELECATRVVSRTNRAFVMEQALIGRVDRAVRATCRSVHVTVGESGPAEIPAELWAAIERANRGAARR